MFKGLRTEILKLNSDVKNITNCEKAKKLRKRLLQIGIPLAIIGIIGGLIFIGMFISGMMNSFGSTVDKMQESVNGSSFNVFAQFNLTPIFISILLFIVGAIGASLASLGFKIVVTGYTTELIDEAANNKCPRCGDKIDENEKFCSNCGYSFNSECASCGNINNPKDKFCTNCGRQLK